MQSFIIISKEQKKAKEYADKMTLDLGISKFDIYYLETEKSVGISDIKSLTHQIFLKPLKGDKKAIILNAFLGITLDAQNAFLKMLEEPPFSTTIIILASSNFFIPTILSRCKLIELDKNLTLSKEENDKYSEILENLKVAKIGDKLKLAQDYSKDKQVALDLMEKLIIASRIKMISENESRGECKRIIETLNKYYKEIKNSNVNLRLALENLFLEI